MVQYILNWFYTADSRQLQSFVVSTRWAFKSSHFLSVQILRHLLKKLKNKFSRENCVMLFPIMLVSAKRAVMKIWTGKCFLTLQFYFNMICRPQVFFGPQIP